MKKGRPKLQACDKRDRILHIRLTDREYKDLKLAAKACHRPMAAVIRMLIFGNEKIGEKNE